MRSRHAAASGPGCSAEMALDLRRQLFLLHAAFLLGTALGLTYDILRPLRDRAGRVGAALLELLFCVLACAAVFLCAMGLAGGGFGAWELAAAVLGSLFYLRFLSPLFLPFLTAALETVCGMIGWCKKKGVKCLVSAKKNFQNVRKCFIVKR